MRLFALTRLTKKTFSTFLLFTPVPGLAHDGAIWCPGTIWEELVYSDGSVTVLPSFRGDWLVICNLQNPYKNVPVETCKNWAAKAMTAVTTKSPILLQYENVPTTTECGSLPNYWAGPAPHYFKLQSQ